MKGIISIAIVLVLATATFSGELSSLSDITGTLSLPRGNCASYAQHVLDSLNEQQLALTGDETFAIGDVLGRVSTTDDSVHLHTEIVVSREPYARETYFDLDVVHDDGTVLRGSYATPHAYCTFESLAGIASCTC